MTKKLYLLNGLAILAVVLNHSAGWGYTAMFWWTDQYRAVTVPNYDQLGSLAYYVLLVIKQLSVFSVPAFLMISGFFIAFASRGPGSKLGWKTIRSRLINLLIPYVIWSVIFYGLDAYFEDAASITEYLQKLVVGQTTTIYYYVPLITQLFLLSPWITRIARSEKWKWLLVGSGLLQLLSIGLQYLNIFRVVRFDPDWLFTNLVFFYCFGVVLGYRLETVKHWLEKRTPVWGCALVITAVITVFETEICFRLIGDDWRGGVVTLGAASFSLFFMLFFLSSNRIQIPQSKLLVQLNNKVYGIYLIHPIMLMFAAKAIYHILPFILGLQIFFQPLLYAAGLLIPWFMMELFTKGKLRKFHVYLFG